MAIFYTTYYLITILLVVTMWKIFTKANKPGWAVLIPFYNIIVLLEIIKKPLWWIFMFLIPVANIVFAIIMNIELAKRFNRGTGFALGLIFLGIIFFPILAFGDDKYNDYEEIYI